MRIGRAAGWRRPPRSGRATARQYLRANKNSNNNNDNNSYSNSNSNNNSINNNSNNSNTKNNNDNSNSNSNSNTNNDDTSHGQAIPGSSKDHCFLTLIQYMCDVHMCQLFVCLYNIRVII